MMIPRTYLSLHCLVLAALVPLASAHAQESSKAAAEAAFRAGQRALEENDTRTACDRFRASLALDDALGTRLHLADCYEMDNRLASAWAAFQEAHGIAAARGDEKRATLAQERARLLEERLPRIMITIAPQARVPGLTVNVGETEFPSGSWSMEIPIDSGVARVSARAPGYATFSQKVVIPTDPTVVHVSVSELVPQASTTRTPARSHTLARPERGGALSAKDAMRGERSKGSNQAVFGWVTAAVGLAGLGGGTYLGVQALDKNNDSKKWCRTNDARLCTPEGAQLRKQSQEHATYATLALAGGGALLLGGLTLVLTAPDDQAVSAVAPLRVNAAFAPGLQTLSLEGSF